MPKRTDIKSVMVIGSGPIVIGQAAEFDYSGTQACRVLREEGIRVILVNSNPATIMTDPEMADATYIEPIATPILEQALKAEFGLELDVDATFVRLYIPDSVPWFSIRSGAARTWTVSLLDAAKCALISFDSTMRSNVSVGPPIDVLMYKRDSQRVGLRVRLEERDPYLQTISRVWGGALQKAFYDTVPNPGWNV